MTAPLRYLATEELVSLAQDLGTGPIEDVGLLDAAAHRPRARYLGTDVYPSIELKAAALLQSLVRNGAMVKGSKALAWLATVVFLDLNEHESGLSPDGAFDIVMQASASYETDLTALADRMRVRRR